MSQTFDGNTTFDGSTGGGTVLENLKTRRNNLALELANLVANKPTYSIDGQSVQWDQHYMTMLEQMMKLNELINMMDPYELPTVMS